MDEKKTYLLNVESNLKQVTEDAVKAKQAWDEAKIALNNLIKAGITSGIEFEVAGAKLRDTQKDYNNAKKSVDLLTQANKSQSGSYEQLYKQWQLAQTQLKLMGGMYTTNANGVRVLSDRYIQQSKVVADSKKALDQFGKGVNDNRLNVGNYSAAIQGALGQMSMMPGVVGRAGSAMQSFMMSFSKVGLIGGIIAGALAVISAPFVAFFKHSQEGMDLLAQKVSGFKAAMTVLRGDLIDLGEKGVDAFEKPDKAANHFWTTVMSFIGPGWVSTGNAMDIANKQGQEFTKTMQELEKEEIKMIKFRAEANLGLKEARLAYTDSTKSIEERMTVLQKSIDIENQTADKEIALQTKRYDALVKDQTRITNAKQDTRVIDRQVAEAEAKIIDLRTESIGREVRDASRLNTLRKEYLTEEYKIYDSEIKLKGLSLQADIESFNFQKKALKLEYDQQNNIVGLSFDEREKLKEKFLIDDAALDKQILDAEKKALEENMQSQLKLVDTIDQKIELANAARLIIYQTYLNAKQKLEEDTLIKTGQTAVTEQDRKLELQKIDLKANFDHQKLKAENEQQNALETNKILNTILDDEYSTMKRSVEYEKLTDNQKLLVDAQYTAAKKQLAEKRKGFMNAELTATADALGAMSEVLGKQTALGKGFAVAQTLINTWAAAEMVMTDQSIPSTWAKIAMMATVILTGLANVQSILAVDTSGKGSSSVSAPTSITSTPIARTAFAQPTGANIFTQPALSQTQLNAVPNQNPLTAEDIAKLMSKLPAPIVTVEDINAKIKEKQKVDVRGNI
jgi:hypothetical protein